MKALQDFISLGPHCCLRLRLESKMRELGMSSGPTNFFDYNLCDDNTLAQFLKQCDIEKYFNEENIIYKKTNETQGHAHVSLKNIYFKSIHDAKNCNSPSEIKNEIKNYIEKYKRRYNRFLKKIKSKNHTVLVYMGKISQENKYAIENGIKGISNKKIPIICLDDFGKNTPEIDQKGIFFQVNYNKFYNCPLESIKKTNWIWMNFLEWDEIFRNILEVHEQTKPRTRKVFL